MASKRSIAKRNGQTKQIKGLVIKSKEILEDEHRSTNAQKEIIALLKNIRIKKVCIDELNEEILNTIEEDQIDEEIKQSTDLDILIDTELEILESYLSALNLNTKCEQNEKNDEKIEIDDSVHSGSSHASEKSQRRRGKAQVRLPTFELKKFSGDPTLWPEFFESFKVAVHENPDLSEIERFTYLKGYLSAEASRCIEGLALTAANYEEALTLLIDRFGNKKLIISRHMDALLGLEHIRSSALVKELRALYDKIMVNIRALKSYEITPEQFGPMLAPVILQKLPMDIKLEVTRRLTEKDWKIDELLEILRVEIRTQETVAVNRMDEFNRKGNHYEQKFQKRDTRFTTGALHIGTRNLKCVFCQGEHFSDKCTLVTDVETRMDIVRKQKLCFKCLGTQHSIRKCRSRMNCFACKSGGHHTAICRTDKNNAIQRHPYNSQENLQNQNKPKQEQQNNISLMTINQNPVFLQTIRVTIADVGEVIKVKANVIFDGGSQKTYISERLAEQLKLKAVGKQELKINAFGDRNGKIVSVKEFNFCVQSKRNDRFYLKGYSVPTICAPLNDYRVDIAAMKFERTELRNFLHEDEEINGDIDILIGSDYYWSMVTEDIIRLDDNLVLIRSKLGYMLSGPMNLNDQKKTAEHAVNCVHVMKVSSNISNQFAVKLTDDNLEKQVENFWNLDTVGILNDEKSIYDINLQKIEFVNGRYQVELPFKEEHPILEDNYSKCVKRLNTLKHKLEKTPLLFDSYDEIIRKQLNEGIVELVDDDEKTPEVGTVTYIPHQAVIKEGKSTTKVRVVYDCSTKAGEHSFNECLYKGTCMTPLIFDSLLRFRLYDIAMVADIESAYLQIAVVPEQRNFLRFLWFKNIQDNDYSIQKLRFTRVLFGAAPSQYLLNAVIRKHAEKYQENDPNFEKMVKYGFYVDDLNISVKTANEGEEFYKKLKIRYADAGFNIRKWRSNDSTLKRIFAEKEVKFENVEKGKVLGITWDDIGDSLLINLKEFIRDEYDEVTKRGILKTMAGFFDPLGWIQPIVIKLKILFQEACKAKIEWDEKVPDYINEKWSKLITEIRSLNEINISRCYCYNEISNPVVKIVMHGFSDASLSAYGACIYLKFIKSNGETKIELVTSKSRVSPLKNLQTIPRLELMGNLILSRLILAVVNGFQNEIEINDIFCHTDSKICLSWIKAVKKEFQPFVQNRVNEIRKNVKPDLWYYCRTGENPADLLTRVENQGISSNQWWKGPEFLKTADFYPVKTTSPGENEMIDFNKELKVEKCSNLLAATDDNPSIDNLINIDKFSDMLRLLRVTSYVIRFVNNIKKRLKKEDCQNSKYPKAVEMKEALSLWVKINQVYLIEKTEYKQIEMQLNCKVDQDGVIRSYGRMKYANIPDHTKAPILLSKDHRLSTLIVLYCHLKVLHRGIKQTLNEIRANYWVTKGRHFVKKIISPCITCKKLNCRPYAYPGHSDLPELRFDDRYPFASTGCDYLGPLYVLPVYGKDNSKLFKAYVVIYTCAATRAVILEVVNSANTKNFLQSFRRFMARRGCPALMISDNGSSFVAEETQEFASNHLIDWKFNIPASPWMGGIWERLVSCIKKCLKRTIGVRQINFIELQTLILEIETILNNRPICNDYDDDIDEVLTPNHLIFGRRLEMMNLRRSNCGNKEEEVNWSKREKHLEKMREHFWNIWRREYVTSLREYHKSEKSKPEVINVNDIILIYNKSHPRHLWKLGRVTELIRSKDGAVRAAKVKCGSTGNIISRPINKLYPIEVRKSRNHVDNTQAETIQQRDDSNVNYEIKDLNSNSENMVADGNNVRPRRNAAVMGELRRKFCN